MLRLATKHNASGVGCQISQLQWRRYSTCFMAGLLVLWAGLSLHGQTTSQQSGEAREEAFRLAAQGNYPAADHIFETELGTNPGDFSLLYNRALVNFFWRRDEKALELLKSVAREDREDANYQALLAAVLTRLGAFKEALPASLEATRLAPSNSENWLRLGALYLHLKMGQHATGVYEKGRSLFRDRPEFILGMGVVEEGQSKFNAAIDLYRQAVTKYPHYEGGYLFLARAYLTARQAVKARKVAADLLAINPQSALAECFVAEAAWMTPGHRAEAATHVQKALQLDPKLAEALVLAAKIELGQGDPQRAVEYLKEAVAEQPHMPSAYYVLSQARRRLGQTEDAQSALGEFHRFERSESLENPLLESLVATRR